MIKPFRDVPKSEWVKDSENNRFKVHLSKDFLVQHFQEADGVIRLSVNRTQRKSDGHWMDRILWEELQEIKDLVGYGNHLAVELYPPEKNVVNVANLRHLWVLPYDLGFMWRRK